MKTFHTSRNLILTVGRRIEKNLPEKADLFFSPSWIEKLEREPCASNVLRQNVRAYANVKEKSVFWSVLHYLWQRHFPYVPWEVVLPHWFTELFVSFLEFLAGNAGWTGKKICGLWLGNL